VYQVSDKEKLGGKLSSGDKNMLDAVINDAVSWLEKNQGADVEDFKIKKKQLKDAVQLIVGKLYEGKEDLRDEL